MSRGSDPGQIRVMLAAAQGYAVLDREGTRIGAFVELTGGDRIAIRHDGVFVWHRRLLPITTVANVVPDQRAVLLTVDGQALAGTEPPPTPALGTSGIAGNIRIQAVTGKTESSATLRRSRAKPIRPTSAAAARSTSRRLTPKTRDARSRARGISRRRSRTEEISAPPNGTCCSSRHQAATRSSNGKVPLPPWPRHRDP